MSIEAISISDHTTPGRLSTFDWFITPHHSQKLASLLQAAHVPTTLVMVQHDGHGLAVPTPGQVEQPSPDALIQMIQDFFVKTLAA